MNQINITITGVTGSGKSTISQAIGRMLRNMHGFDVTINDEDGESEHWDYERIEQCLNSLSDDTSINITTQQASRAQYVQRSLV